MQPMSSYTFGKTEKLCSRTVINELFRVGRSFSVHPIRVVMLQKEESDATAKLLISVPKKRFRKAVDRNHVKRLIRETYRLNKGKLMEKWSTDGKYFALAFVYIGTDIPSYADLNEAMNRIVEKLNSK
ncbi:MAG: ribonuclease P protein component [Bacteroidetes bacterium]|nr:MAG: ribonuclease P protein component [Bacteroidota bacterium]